MPGHRTVLHGSGPLTDHDRVNNLALARRRPGTLRPPVRPTSTQMLCEFTFQAATGLDEQCQIDRLV